MRKEGPISKTTFYRRKKEAERLGCTVEELPDTRGKHKNHARKSNHPRWNNGISLSSHGYIKIQVGKNHPLSDPNGYAYLHHLVIVSAGMDFNYDYLVHHIDRNTKNNQLDNLHVMKRGDHLAHHINGKLVKMPELDGHRWSGFPEVK